MLRCERINEQRPYGGGVPGGDRTELGKALGAAHVSELEPGPLAFLTVIGVVAGAIGWIQIAQRATDPDSALRRVVPIVVLGTFVPDLLLGVGGTAWGAVATLICAHVTVAALAVAVFAKTLPVTNVSARRR